MHRRGALLPPGPRVRTARPRAWSTCATTGRTPSSSTTTYASTPARSRASPAGSRTSRLWVWNPTIFGDYLCGTSTSIITVSINHAEFRGPEDQPQRLHDASRARPLRRRDGMDRQERARSLNRGVPASRRRAPAWQGTTRASRGTTRSAREGAVTASRTPGGARRALPSGGAHRVIAALAGVQLSPSLPIPVAAQAPFRVEDVLSYSFASGLVAAARRVTASPGSRTAEGARNVWVAEGPDLAKERARNGLSSFDDGQESCLHCVYDETVRRPSLRQGRLRPNRQGEVPDPLLTTPDEEDRAIWIQSAGTEARPVRDRRGGRLLRFPTGRHARIAFSAGSATCSRAPARGRVAEPDQGGPDSRKSPGSLTWSPDGGDRLAFVSGRGDHAFIGVLSLGERAACGISTPASGTTARPVWSPDGTRHRVPTGPQRAGRPHVLARGGRRSPSRSASRTWTSGVGREVWKAPEKARGSRRSAVSNARRISSSGVTADRLVFPWEGDGWKRLYSVSVSGRRAGSLLTPGEGSEVQFAVSGARWPHRSVRLGTPGTSIGSTSSAWRRFEGGAPEALITPETGIEWGAVATAAEARLRSRRLIGDRPRAHRSCSSKR